MELQERRPDSPGRQRLGPEERRRQLIDATVAVVSRCGYQNASLTAIAREAGVSKGLLWHYFEDGDDLMKQTVRETLVRVRHAVGESIDLSAPIPQVIRAAIARAAALLETHGPELRAMQEIAQNQQLGQSELDETHDLQAALFQRGVDEGSLRPIDTHTFAVTYQGAVDAMLAYLGRHPEVDRAEYATTVADILLEGVAVPQVN